MMCDIFSSSLIRVNIDVVWDSRGTESLHQFYSYWPLYFSDVMFLIYKEILYQVVRH